MGATGSKAPRIVTKEGRSAGTKFDDVELHVISLTYKDLAGLSKGEGGGASIDKATFLQNFPVPGLVGDRLFHALDINKSGRISFDEFVVGLAVCCRGTLDEKMRFLFGVYDMNEDGLISRDELLLMLNQVPRTLLNIGIDPDGREPRTSPPPLDSNLLNLEAGVKTRGGGGSFSTPARSTLQFVQANSSAAGRRTEPFGGDDRTPPSIPPAPASGKRGRAREKGNTGGSPTPVWEASPQRMRSMFTNESIADQALKDFGEGPDKPLTFEQFRQWAQSTPVVQALLQGAFPSDAHFSLATSPTARRSTCETLSALESPRRKGFSPALATPHSLAESRSAATALSAVAAWSASASVRPRPRSSGGGLGPSMRHRSFGGEADFLSTASGSGEQLQQPAVGSRTPSRALSRNTSYDNLLRSPLVGQGVGPTLSSSLPRGFFGVDSVAEEGVGEAAEAKPNLWRWEQGGDDVTVAAAPKSGIRKERDKEREREIPPTPLSTGRTRRMVRSSSGPGPLAPCGGGGGWGGGFAPALTVNPSTSSSSSSFLAAPNRSFQRRNSNTAGGVAGDDVASGPNLPPITPRAPSQAVAGSSFDAGQPPMTPAKLCGSGLDIPTPPSTTDMTRKARKLAMMAAMAETAVISSGGGGNQPGTLDLLALANAAAIAEKLPAPAPRRGKLMRYLSQDGGPSHRTSNDVRASSRSAVLMKMVTQEKDVTQGRAGVSRASWKSISFRRLNSLSSLEHKQREESVLGGGDPLLPHGVGAPKLDDARMRGGPTPTKAATVTPGTGGGGAAPTTMITSSPRVRASELGGIFHRSSDADDDPTGSSPGDDSGGMGCSIGSSDGAGGAVVSKGPTKPPMPTTIVLPSYNVNLGLPHSNISPLLKADRGVFPFVGISAEEEAAQALAGAEAVVRDCLYNSHGIVSLDGYLWKPGSLRLVRRWMMLVDNTLYYFVKPGDRKPRGVISLPGCIAEAVSNDDEREDEAADGRALRKEPRSSRVPSGFFGVRLVRPNNHGKGNTTRLFLAKTAQERDEWVAELRVASRVVPLEDVFEVQALLRKGAFASVHRCVRKDTGEEYAVKVIDKTSLSSHEKFLLRGEIGALKLVSHPNVVRLEAVHEDPRSIAIVMTLCRGGDLWDKVRSQPLRCFNTTQARIVMRPLCEAVSYLHTLGILHRDIKPENILLIDDGAGNLGGVTLSDFGFSHQVSPKSRLACGKQLMGTPSYMAPESILHGMYGKEVDWFSCGCVLYMMLMGRAPFAGNSPSEIFRNTCHGRLGLGRGGASLWDKLPAAARELIVGLMQLDHNLRFTGEQAMSHRFLAMSDDGEAVEGEGGSGTVGNGQQQQAEGASAGRRRRQGSRNGSRSVCRKSSRSTSSSATSSATTPSSSSGSTPGREDASLPNSRFKAGDPQSGRGMGGEWVPYGGRQNQAAR